MINKVLKTTVQGVLLCTLLAMCRSQHREQVTTPGIKTDSAFIVVQRKPADTEGMLDLVVKIHTGKQVSADQRKQLAFAMEKNFELVSDSVVLAPVFCQPLAPGSSNEFLYWVSFETNKGRRGQKEFLRVLPNVLIRETLNYKL